MDNKFKMNGITLPNYEKSILNTISSILKYYKIDNGHSTLDNIDSLLNKPYNEDGDTLLFALADIVQTKENKERIRFIVFV